MSIGLAFKRFFLRLVSKRHRRKVRPRRLTRHERQRHPEERTWPALVIGGADQPDPPGNLFPEGEHKSGRPEENESSQPNEPDPNLESDPNISPRPLSNEEIIDIFFTEYGKEEE